VLIVSPLEVVADANTEYNPESSRTGKGSGSKIVKNIRTCKNEGATQKNTQ